MARRIQIRLQNQRRRDLVGQLAPPRAAGPGAQKGPLRRRAGQAFIDQSHLESRRAPQLVGEFARSPGLGPDATVKPSRQANDQHGRFVVPCQRGQAMDQGVPGLGGERRERLSDRTGRVADSHAHTTAPRVNGEDPHHYPDFGAAAAGSIT